MVIGIIYLLYANFRKNLTLLPVIFITLKFELDCPTKMPDLQNTCEMTNSVDPDQTASAGAV